MNKYSHKAIDKASGIGSITLQIAVIIFVVEIMVMSILVMVENNINPYFLVLLDSMLLTLLCSPIIYYKIILPYITQQHENLNIVRKEKEKQQRLVRKFESTQYQLLQTEKMASIGHLAAGVAHEINNPIGFVNGNLGALKQYVEDFIDLISSYDEATLSTEDSHKVQALKAKIGYDDFFKEDIVSLIKESQEGLERVKKIVLDLKDFAHIDNADWVMADLQKGLDNTINIISSKLTFKAELVREYAGIPKITCIPYQLNEVFMNLLLNAAHAIKESGKISIQTGFDDENVWVSIKDTGEGISEEHISKVFDPFFTTKPIGTGTGLGLSVCYGIIKNHHGRIEIDSQPGEGAMFKVILPRVQPEEHIS